MKILIDTGSKYNFVKPNFVPPDVTVTACDFKIRTPTGESKGQGCISINISNIFDVDIVEKFYVYDFCDNYDILIGHETSSRIDASIDFKTNCLETKNCKIPLLGMSNIKIIKIHKG